MQQHATLERLPYRSHSSAESRHAFRNTILHLGSPSSFTVHQFVFRQGLWTRPPFDFVPPMKYLSRKILLFDTSLRSFSISAELWDSAPLLPGIVTRECGGQFGLSEGVTLTGLTCDTEWPGVVRQIVNLFVDLVVFLPSTMVQHWIFQFYLYFQASNNHLARCDKSGPDKRSHLISNMASWRLYKTIHSPALFFLSVRPFHISLSLPPSLC